MNLSEKHAKMLEELISTDFHFEKEKKPVREKRISNDDVTDLKIALETMTIDQLMQQL